MAEPRKRRSSLGNSKRFNIFHRDRFTCMYCGRKPPEATLEVDHIVPVAEGGDDDDTNLVTSCKECNAGKRTKLLQNAPQPLSEMAEEMAEQDEQLRRYSMIAWDRRKRIQDQSNVVAEWLFGEALDYWHPYMIQFRVLLRRMALPDMLPICDTVLSKAHVQTREHRFRYFMKVAYAELYGDTERPPMTQPTTDQQGSNPDDIPV